jgi:DNA-binding transcriptional LysR family regulator
MRVRQLEFLLALEREQHFGRAADACHVTQPTLSEAVQALEAELGLALVRRGPRYEGLTAEGIDLLPWARRAVAAHHDVAAEAELLRGAGRGTLRIAAIPTALPAVARLTAAFVAGRNDVRVEVRSATSSEVLRGLRAFDVDLGVTYLDGLTDPGWHRHHLYDEEYVLVAPAGSALGRPGGGAAAATDSAPGAEAVGAPRAGDTVPWSALDGLRMCLLTDEMRNRQLLEARFSAAGARPVVVATTDSPGVLLDHVRAGIASVVASSWLDGQVLPDGLVVRGLDGLDAAPPPIGIVRPPDARPRPLVQAFLNEAGATRG